ncbi:hypothetical protein B2K_39455 [Paenibacillus mucilaginosus K02]|uniref:Uncharacterized protein n=1 Tax=Paenibacillus mucilaginosus K02 TaxID=997761 RepID=R9ULM1_9BACL|nr:hypothetical protein B2K_39455 [Paenibacillus mucilaginosus K02]
MAGHGGCGGGTLKYMISMRENKYICNKFMFYFYPSDDGIESMGVFVPI